MSKVQAHSDHLHRHTKITTSKNLWSIKLKLFWFPASQKTTFTVQLESFQTPSSFFLFFFSASGALCSSRSSLTCFTLWWIQLIGHDLERHTPVYIRSGNQSKNQVKWAKYLPPELRHRTVWSYRSRLQNKMWTKQFGEKVLLKRRDQEPTDYSGWAPDPLGESSRRSTVTATDHQSEFYSKVSSQKPLLS